MTEKELKILKLENRIEKLQSSKTASKCRGALNKAIRQLRSLQKI